MDPRRGCLCCSHSGAFGYALLQTSSIRAAFCVDFCPVVTNVVSPRAFSPKTLIFLLRLTTFVTEVLARRLESCWFDDVCNVGRPLVARPGPAAHGTAVWPCRRPWVLHLGPVDQAARSPETGVAFACWYLYGVETAIAFADAKSVFLAQFSGAEVTLVSRLPCWG